MKALNQNNTLLPILTICVIFTVIVSFFAGRNTASTRIMTANPSINAKPSPTPTITPMLVAKLDTQRWQRFTNSKYGYTVMYPDYWYIRDYSAPTKEISTWPIVGFFGATGLTGNFEVSVNETDTTSHRYECGTLEQCIDLLSKKFPAQYDLSDTYFYGQKAKIVNYTDTTNNLTYYHVFAIIQNNFYHFTMTYKTEAYTYVDATYKAILGSFRLTK